MRIRTEQADISVADTGGEGLPLLMLHGSGASKDVFAHQIQSSLAERFRLVAMDLPGHGDSTDARDPAKGYSITGFADTVAEVLNSLGIQRAAIYGWSLGGVWVIG